MAEAALMQPVQHLLSGMAERGMTQIVTQGYGFHEILVEQEGFSDCPRDLGDLEGMGEAGPVVVVGGEKEDLRLIL
jgi:hypothetical protein